MTTNPPTTPADHPFDPLREPDHVTTDVYPLDIEIAVTRKILAETAPLNIHSYTDMLRAAVALDCRVRALLASLDAERGETQ
ncbi:hypothetical protein AB0912_00200 [Streptomyces sp. NPDC007084]|uniref:hypothetical protein n=1 Tax=Streptomyces sp. NPDC007084 TaxID=3154313 RepID=UPI0034551D97